MITLPIPFQTICGGRARVGVRNLQWGNDSSETEQLELKLYWHQAVHDGESYQPRYMEADIPANGGSLKQSERTLASKIDYL